MCREFKALCICHESTIIFVRGRRGAELTPGPPVCYA